VKKLLLLGIVVLTGATCQPGDDGCDINTECGDQMLCVEKVCVEARPILEEYFGIAESKAYDYDIDFEGVLLPGRIEVEAIDVVYKEGVEAYKVNFKNNSNLVATRWYQLNKEGMFLLGEAVNEQANVVEREYVDPIKLIPYPLESENGTPVQSWSTTSQVVDGVDETHRFHNQGGVSLDLPAGSYEGYHLVHTKEVEGQESVVMGEYFTESAWYIQFEYPQGSVWKLGLQ
jgi:hypothetical protein